MSQYEKLGVFYLGTENKNIDGTGQGDFMLLDSRDLVTHAVCVGMTGSGKTGLGICLLEEAAMDGIPAIIVDPKGDMGNLLLTFPDLLASDFMPWVHPEEAEAEGISLEELAEKKANTWREGLASSMQDGERIRAMRENAEFALYTPGGQFGRPLSLESMFQRPSAEAMQDAELLQEIVSTTATSLLHLVGIKDADPVSSREHVLLSTLIQKAWTEGSDLAIANLINWISKPPITKIGVMDIETYLPEKDRFALALRFNNLIASPAFSAFMEGEPFDIPSLLYTAEGKPKISILTLAHLADAERMFFVTLLLNRIIAWMRTEQGTSSLRALFYMDEVFGYFPPIANPPAKKPLLTLLKTARAYGLGIVLATQNPADIDYKGLSNVGTWFVGRLTTERDRTRLLEGMADESVEGTTRAELGRLIAGLKQREFVLRSVRGGQPTLFTTRFCMSYLAGPLTREQIRDLVADQRPQVSVVPPVAPPVAEIPASPVVAAPEPEPLAEVSVPPPTPSGIVVSYLPGVPGQRYQPVLSGFLSVFYENAKLGISKTEQVTRFTSLGGSVVPVDWNNVLDMDYRLDDFEQDPPAGATYKELPAEAKLKTSFTAWQRALVDTVWRDSVIEVREHKKLGLISGLEESERDFVARVKMAAREKRDEEFDVIEAKYEKKRLAIEEKIAKAEERVDRVKDQAKDAKLQSAISFGAAALGAVLGKSLLTQSTVYKSATAAKSASRAVKSSSNIGRAEESFDRVEQQLELLEADMKKDLEAISERYDAAADEIVTTAVRPLKRDVVVNAFVVTWMPER
ncbi:MAG: hypothetical protein PHN96_02605 [Eubacteriales bacterium]|nr:hypothetical protein [Eubacteriales bacterium]